MSTDSQARYALASTALLILGVVDLVRGVLHTFFIHWAVQTFAHLNLAAAGQDQLMLLGAFGISNLLTGAIYILVSYRAKELSEYVLLMVVCAYAIGIIGLKLSGVTPQADFNGKYFMFGYLAVCVLTLVVSALQRRRTQING